MPSFTHAFCVTATSLTLLFCAHRTAASDGKPVDVRSYPTLQAAIDANPGRILVIPAGEYTLTTALTIRHDNTELHGPARLIQTNPKQSIVLVENVRRIRLNNLSLTRSEGQQEAEAAGIDVVQCENVELSQLRVS